MTAPFSTTAGGNRPGKDGVVRIATWNLEWPGGPRQQAARSVIESRDPDIVVTTEDCLRPWPAFPHMVDAGDDWGYRSQPDRRKVVAWSRTPWRQLDVATPGATSGRLVVASTTVNATTYTIVAVCIPWSAAHVSTGRADRRRWDEHLEYCRTLRMTLSELAASGPTIVAGDFNQRAPRERQPGMVWDALQTALDGFTIATTTDRVGLPLIDHIAHDDQVSVSGVDAWTNTADGRRLSDHAGVCAELTTVRSSGPRDTYT